VTRARSWDNSFTDALIDQNGILKVAYFFVLPATDTCGLHLYESVNFCERACTSKYLRTELK
jgi:hypothetical protein